MTVAENSSSAPDRPDHDPPIHVAIGVLVDHQPPGVATPDGPHVLIAKRPHDTVLGGYWELPGGKIEAGEAASDCLAREFHEELGVTVHVGQPLPVIEHRYAHGLVRLHPFYCTRTTDSPQPRNLAVVEHRWVPAASLADYQFPEGNSDLIRRVIEALS